jgi:hypothetical protein
VAMESFNAAVSAGEDPHVANEIVVTGSAA